jgi:xanthine dehydrogenase YagS FAD-binding subunit
MKPFTYMRPADGTEALSLAAMSKQTRFLGGGTNLVDLMRQHVETPDELVDVTRLRGNIKETTSGGLLIGAAVRNSTLAAHPHVRQNFPVLSRALLSGASAQIRNMATVGGNIMQRTRCSYFYDVTGARCNKRNPGVGCDAIGGFTRYHAVLGASEHCVATHPSDMCVALAALDATVHVAGPDGDRSVPITEFHVLPGDHPEVETVLRSGELITAVEIPASTMAARSEYRKVRDRSSYAFALVSVAGAIEIAQGRIADVRIALGGVAAKPWRAGRAEEFLRGKEVSHKQFLDAAESELAAARPLEGNRFKIELAKRTIAAVLGDLARDAA